MFDAGDIKIIRGGGSVHEARVDDRNTSGASATIKAGEPVKRDNANFVLKVATGDPEISTDILVGVASGESSEAAGSEGVVPVELVRPGTELQGRANTASNINTDAKLKGVELDYVTFDVSSGAVTIDEDENDDPNVHGLCILRGDIVKGTLDVAVHVNATLFGSLVGQTMD